MKELNICRICEQFPPGLGGLSAGMLNLGMEQYKIGHTLTVITRSCSGDLEYDSKLPFSVIRIPAKRSVVFGWKAFEEIKKLSVKPEIVHSHGPAAFSYLIRRNKDDAPLIHHLHAVRKYQYTLYQKALYRLRHAYLPSYLKYSRISPLILKEYFLESYICRHSDHIVTVAEYFSDELAMQYNISNHKITPVLNGTSFIKKNFHSETKIPSPSKSRDIKILYIGRFDWHKRIDLLIRAMTIVNQSFPNAQLVLVGDGEARKNLEKLIKLYGLKSKIDMPGWVGIEQIFDFYLTADCFCLPSISEGLPKVLLDAMSAGVPLLSADNKAARELFQNGKYGSIVKNPSPEAWSNAIISVLNGGATIEGQVRKNLARINKHYSWAQVAQRIDAVYQKVLEK